MDHATHSKALPFAHIQEKRPEEGAEGEASLFFVQRTHWPKGGVCQKGRY